MDSLSPFLASSFSTVMVSLAVTRNGLPPVSMIAYIGFLQPAEGTRGISKGDEFKLKKRHESSAMKGFEAFGCGALSEPKNPYFSTLFGQQHFLQALGGQNLDVLAVHVEIVLHLQLDVVLRFE